MTVNRADGATVFELDGRPAWEVWRERTREAVLRTGVDLDAIDEEDIGAFLLRYEAGLASGGAHKIRAPLSRGEDGSLSFAYGVPEGAAVRITESTPERLVDSAIEAARLAKSQLEGEVAGA